VTEEWQAAPLGLTHCELGESPLFSEADSTLYFVDIVGQELHAYSLMSGKLHTEQFPRPVCAVVLTEGDQRVTILDDEISWIDRGVTRQLWSGGLDPTLRFNDVQVDPAGNLLVGTTHREYVPGSAGLYHLAEGQLRPLRENLGLSNGMGWSAHGDEFYHIDTLSGEILVASYDCATATITREIRRIDLSSEDGVPDGMAVDSAGCLWVAMFGGGQVLRLSAEGDRLGRVVVDVERPTSVCFGGPGHSELFITTATNPGGSSTFEGDIHRASVGVSGRPANRLRATAKGDQ
jgi:sugar lactone lactonase YvrE